MHKGWVVAVLLVASSAHASTPRVKVETVRHIPVTIVTDPYFRKLPNWRGVAQGALALATEDLQQQVGLKFELTTEATWDVPESSATSMAEALRGATQAFRGHAGILALLLGPREQKIPGAELGYAFLGRPAFLVVAASGSGHAEKQDLAMLIRHELGHVFGIPHLDGRTIMNQVPDARAWEFGELGIEVLRANRRMQFAPGDAFLGCDLEMLRDVYALLDERGQMEPVLWLELARSFEQKGDMAAGEEIYEAALKRDRASVNARLGIARCAAARQDTTKVLVLAHALARMPLSPRQLSDLGNLWMQVHEFVAAESTLSRAVSQDPHPEDWFHLGVARLELKNSDGAAIAFQRYLEVDPKGTRRDEALRYLEARR